MPTVARSLALQETKAGAIVTSGTAQYVFSRAARASASDGGNTELLSSPVELNLVRLRTIVRALAAALTSGKLGLNRLSARLVRMDAKQERTA